MSAVLGLEPAVAEAVRRQAALYPRPPELLSPAEHRALAAPVPPPPPRPAGVEVREAVLELPGRRLALRHFVPGAAAAARVLYLHGGGFNLGGLDSHDAACAALAAETGAEVVALDYRKLPDHPFPAAYEDTLAAARALAPGRRLALAGDSSGANLALAAALALRGEAAAPVALLLHYPIIGLDFDTPAYRENAEAPALSAARCWRIWSDYLAGEVEAVRARRDARAAPLLAEDLSGLPHAVITVAGHDPLRGDGEILAARLHGAGGSATLVAAAGLPHGFLKWRGVSPRAAAAIAAANAAFRAALG
jgi:acetyl esterase